MIALSHKKRYFHINKALTYLCCSWSQCDCYRHQSLFRISRHGAKGGAEEHPRGLTFNILQFDFCR